MVLICCSEPSVVTPTPPVSVTEGGTACYVDVRSWSKRCLAASRAEPTHSDIVNLLASVARGLHLEDLTLQIDTVQQMQYAGELPGVPWVSASTLRKQQPQAPRWWAGCFGDT